MRPSVALFIKILVNFNDFWETTAFGARNHVPLSSLTKFNKLTQFNKFTVQNSGDQLQFKRLV